MIAAARINIAHVYTYYRFPPAAASKERSSDKLPPKWNKVINQELLQNPEFS